jgi:alpha-1,2-mannosyltransferase
VTETAALRKWSTVAWALCAAAALRVAVGLRFAVPPNNQDSWFPMARALDFIRDSSGALVYQTLLFSKHIKFQYPTSGLLLLDFMRHVGIDTPAQYNAINVAAMVVGGVVFAFFCRRVIGAVHCFGVRFPLEPVAFIVWIKFFPDQLSLQLGQIQVLLGLLFLVACVAVTYDKRFLAGLLIGATATVKPQFLVFGLWALWRRDWYFVAAFAAVTAGATLLAIGLYGWDAQIGYLQVLSYLSKHGECFHLNQSVNGILNRYLGPACVDSDPDADASSPGRSSWFPPYIAPVYFATLVSSLVMIAIPFVVRPKLPDRASTLLAFCLAGILFTMASPIAWVHHYNILLPGYVVAAKVALDRWRSERAWGILVPLGISFVLTGCALMPVFDPTIPSRNLQQSHVFLGACLLVAVLVAQTLRLGRADPALAGAIRA